MIRHIVLLKARPEVTERLRRAILNRPAWRAQHLPDQPDFVYATTLALLVNTVGAIEQETKTLITALPFALRISMARDRTHSEETLAAGDSLLLFWKQKAVTIAKSRAHFVFDKKANRLVGKNKRKFLGRATKSAERQKTPSAWGTLVGARAAINGDFFNYTNYSTVGLAMGDGEVWAGTADSASWALFAAGKDGRISNHPH